MRSETPNKALCSDGGKEGKGQRGGRCPTKKNATPKGEKEGKRGSGVAKRQAEGDFPAKKKAYETFRGGALLILFQEKANLNEFGNKSFFLTKRGEGKEKTLEQFFRRKNEFSPERKSLDGRSGGREVLAKGRPTFGNHRRFQKGEREKREKGNVSNCPPPERVGTRSCDNPAR